MAAHRDSIEQRLQQFRHQADEAQGTELEALVREALGDRHHLLVARAAEVCAERLIFGLEADLEAAFERFLVDPQKTDPRCSAKTAIARALVALDCLDADFYLRGMVYRQPAPQWGGVIETAAELRAACALGLVATPYRRPLPALVDLLADSEPEARMGAVRAIACTSPPAAAEAVLRTKALLGDREPDVLRDCLSALLQIEPDESIDFVARFLDHRDDEVAEVAAIALGDSRLEPAFTVLRARWEAAVIKGPRERTLLRAAAHHRSEMAIDWLLSVVVEGDSGHARFAAMLLALNRSNARLMARLRAAVAERGQQELETLVDLVLKEGEG